MQKTGINKYVLINEQVSIADAIFKYTIRDFISGMVNLTPASVGIGTRMLWYKLILKSCGKGLLMKSMTTIKFPERVSIGNHVGISEYTLLDGDGGITIGDFTRIASHVSIIAFSHNFMDRNVPVKLQGKISKGITIGEDCWIGTGVRILDGVVVGKGAVIGAGSVVTKNIPPYSIAVGIPAHVIKERQGNVHD